MASAQQPPFIASDNVLKKTNTYFDEFARPRIRPLNVDPRHPTIISGKDYRDEPFIEITPQEQEAYITPCPKLLSFDLLRITNKNGPGRVYTGRTWTDLFAQKTSEDWFRWINVAQVVRLANKKGYRTNDDYKFRLWFCAPGLIHVEESDDGEWTMKDIFGLPPWMIIG